MSTSSIFVIFRLLPFGAGRRVCPGETLARNRLSLMVTTLVQRFTFLPPDGCTKLPTDPHDYIMGLPVKPYPYQIKAEPRRDTHKAAK